MAKATLPVVELGTSAAYNLKVCEQKHVYADIRQLEPISSPVPMKLGSWLHLLLGAHYLSRHDVKRMPHWTKVHAEMTQQWRGTREQLRALGAEVPPDTDDELPDRALRIMDAYIHHYTVLAASRGWEDFDVIAIEAPYTFDISVADRLIVRARATVDSVIRDRRGKLWIFESKTGASFPYDEMLRILEPQVTLQIVAAENQLGERVEGAIYNWIRTIPPVTNSVINKDGSLSKRPGYTDHLTFQQTLRRRDLDPLDEPYATRLRELANPETSKFFRRVLVHRTKRVTLRAMDNHARLALRSEKLRRKPHTAVLASIPTTCRMCVFRRLCEADLVGDRQEVANVLAHFRPRTDERSLLRLEAELADES